MGAVKLVLARGCDVVCTLEPGPIELVELRSLPLLDALTRLVLASDQLTPDEAERVVRDLARGVVRLRPPNPDSDGCGPFGRPRVNEENRP